MNVDVPFENLRDAISSFGAIQLGMNIIKIFLCLAKPNPPFACFDFLQSAVSVTWGALQNDDKQTEFLYKLQIAEIQNESLQQYEFRNVYLGQKTLFSMNGDQLKKWGKYVFRVCAQSEYGEGPFSQISNVIQAEGL